MDAQAISVIVANYWQIVAGCAVAVFLLIIWCVRLEAKVLYQQERTEQLQLRLNQVEAAAETKDTAMWAKMDAVQGLLNTVLQGLGRLEGKVDGIPKRDG